MPNTLSPVALVQNPAFGALMLWKFGAAFQEEKLTEHAILPYCFLVLPLVLHSETAALINSTNPSSGLPQLAKKLSERRELQFSLQERAIQLRGLTLESIGTGVSAGLLSVDYEKASMRSNAARLPTLPQRTKKHTNTATKIGKWFARLEPAQVFTLLRVEV